ncbi:hypothetical protein [Amycolatopsis minnesotensis]
MTASMSARGTTRSAASPGVSDEVPEELTPMIEMVRMRGLRELE